MNDIPQNDRSGPASEDCPEIREQLHEWIDRELDRDVASVVAKHVDTCMSCAEVARSIQHLKTLVRTKAIETPMPPRLEAKVREAIALETLQAERKKVIQLPMARVRWIAAAALVAVMLPIAIFGLTRDLHAQVTEAAFRSHLESIGGICNPRYQCMCRTSAEKSLADHLGIDVRLPEFEKGKVCLKGVSKVNLDGTEAGKVFYEIDGGTFSLFVIPQKIRGGESLCFCKPGKKLNVFCSNEGDYCFTYVTELEGEAFRTEILEPALKRAIEFPAKFSAKHPEER